MLAELELTDIVIFLFIIFAITYGIYEYRKNGFKDDPKKAIFRLKIATLGTGICALVLAFNLPSTPSLATFGYPDTIEQIQSQERLLSLLQDYNEAIVGTTRTLYFFLFIFIFWCLVAFLNFSNALSTLNLKKSTPETS